MNTHKSVICQVDVYPDQYHGRVVVQEALTGKYVDLGREVEDSFKSLPRGKHLIRLEIEVKGEIIQSHLQPLEAAEEEVPEFAIF